MPSDIVNEKVVQTKLEWIISDQRNDTEAILLTQTPHDSLHGHLNLVYLQIREVEEEDLTSNQLHSRIN